MFFPLHKKPSPNKNTTGSNPVAPNQDPFPAGVEVLHNPANATIDVCFIHGLAGNRNSTWTPTGDSREWPRTLLPQQLPHARILTYGYDSYPVRGTVASSNRLIDHAMNFLSDLTADREISGATSRPLIFVAHSLGGLVCKEALLLSRNNPEPAFLNLYKCFKGIIFMGTPHRGSWMADWAKISASALSPFKSVNKSLLEILQTNDQLLESIQVGFLSMIRQLRESGVPVGVTCFFEEQPLQGAGMVVPKFSATLDGYNAMSIHANHRSMVKFQSPHDNGFKRVVAELMRWESETRSESHTRHPQSRGLDRRYESGIRNDFARHGIHVTQNGHGASFTGATFNGPVKFG